MEIALTDKAKEDLAFWKKSGNKNIQAKISALVLSIQETPYDGLGKPEPLKYELAGLWSRRINSEHRIVYEVGKEQVTIHSFRGHY